MTFSSASLSQSPATIFTGQRGTGTSVWRWPYHRDFIVIEGAVIMIGLVGRREHKDISIKLSLLVILDGTPFASTCAPPGEGDRSRLEVQHRFTWVREVSRPLKDQMMNQLERMRRVERNQELCSTREDGPEAAGGSESAVPTRGMQSAVAQLQYEDDERRNALRSTLTNLADLLFPFRHVDPRVHLYGRVKSIASTTEEMAKNDLAVDQVLDIIGIRAITRHTRDCYRLTNRIHGEFEVVENEYNDYIAVPKPNGYRVLAYHGDQPVRISSGDPNPHPVDAHALRVWSCVTQAIQERSRSLDAAAPDVKSTISLGILTKATKTRR